MVWALGASEAINVGPVLGHQNKKVKILFDEFSLALRPDGMLGLVESYVRESCGPLGKGE